MAYPQAIARLLTELEKLPGVGPRTAERLAHHLLQVGDTARELAKAIEDAVATIHPCSACQNLSESDPCPICVDPGRDQRRILVVEQSRDVEAMERAGWKGVYHVLHGSVKADGRRGAELTLDALRRRVERGAIDELILGTDPDFEGDGTALLVASLAEQSRVGSGRPLVVSRLARGVPTGSAIEYTNPAVLAEALSERRELPRSGGAA